MKDSKYTDEMKLWIKENGSKYFHKELLKLFNEKFNTDFELGSIVYLKGLMGVKCEVRKYFNHWGVSRERKYTDEMCQWLKENSEGKFKEELAKEFNERFKTDYSVLSIYCKRKDLKIKSNVFTVHKRASPGSEKTWFRKGDAPHNTHKLFTEIERDLGYIWIKVAEPNIWKSKHTYIWEQYHKKEVPDGMMVIFLDGNNRNFNIDNLMLISKGENRYLNCNKLRTEDAELTKSNILLRRLRKRTKEINNGN